MFARLVPDETGLLCFECCTRLNEKAPGGIPFICGEVWISFVVASKKGILDEYGYCIDCEPASLVTLLSPGPPSIDEQMSAADDPS